MPVYRKLKTKADREFWAFVDKIGRQADKLPKYLKGGPSKRKAEVALPPPACIGCGGKVLVGYTIERKPGPFCRACWEAVKGHVQNLADIDAALLGPSPPQYPKGGPEERKRLKKQAPSKLNNSERKALLG